MSHGCERRCSRQLCIVQMIRPEVLSSDQDQADPKHRSEGEAARNFLILLETTTRTAFNLRDIINHFALLMRDFHGF
jgi:hypothetical protein